MKLLVYVLIKVELLQPLLTALAKDGVSGATIIDSTGMGRELADRDEFSLFGSLKALMSNHNHLTKTLLFVTEDAKTSVITDVIEKVVGKLDKPDSGIIFTLPIDSVKGFKKAT
jgi:nitrogen regulatory protein PII